MKAVPNLTNDPSFQQRSTIVDDIIEAARSMVENDGVRAVCSACGFFGNYQQQVRRALDVPVAMSSLVQIPWIESLIRPDQRIGILTANKGSHDKGVACKLWCGAPGPIGDQGCSGDRGVCGGGGYAGPLQQHRCCPGDHRPRGRTDSGEQRSGAILLECSDMPPYAAAVQEATQLPVFDFITLIRWLRSGVAQRPYSGWI